MLIVILNNKEEIQKPQWHPMKPIAHHFTINVNEIATNLARVDELKLCKGSNSDIDLNTLFTLSVSNADMLKLEELLLVVKYKF